VFEAGRFAKKRTTVNPTSASLVVWKKGFLRPPALFHEITRPV
jgi:hypothetical protein